MAVGCILLCDGMRLDARLGCLASIHFRILILDNATGCDTLQNGQKRTQNPPRATSWGFDSPSRHQYNQSFRVYCEKWHLGRCDSCAQFCACTRVYSRSHRRPSSWLFTCTSGCCRCTKAHRVEHVPAGHSVVTDRSHLVSLCPTPLRSPNEVILEQFGVLRLHNTVFHRQVQPTGSRRNPNVPGRGLDLSRRFATSTPPASPQSASSASSARSAVLLTAHRPEFSAGPCRIVLPISPSSNLRSRFPPVRQLRRRS